MKISHLVISISPILLIACSGIESYQKKMERYQARTGENILVPEIKAANLPFQTPKQTRFPASKSASITDTSMTNKKLYFLSLYAQYESLKSISNNSNAPDIALCPSFHTGLVTYKEKHPVNQVSSSDKIFSYKKADLSSEAYVTAHPELYLPVSKDDVTPKVIDMISKSDSNMQEIVQNAVNLHLAKTYTELRELCDSGTSSNYYIYENLITHIKNAKFSPSTASMNILLKTTLFSNRAIITSINKPSTTGRTIASEKSKIPFTDEVVARFNAQWANDYFNFIKETK
jgi:hypothetical protein